MLEEQRLLIMNTETAAAATEKYSIKKVLLKIFQNSLENTCVGVLFFNKVAGLKTATSLKKRLWHRCFVVNFSNF